MLYLIACLYFNRFHGLEYTWGLCRGVATLLPTPRVQRHEIILLCPRREYNLHQLACSHGYKGTKCCPWASRLASVPSEEGELLALLGPVSKECSIELHVWSESGHSPCPPMLGTKCPR